MKVYLYKISFHSFSKKPYIIQCIPGIVQIGTPVSKKGLETGVFYPDNNKKIGKNYLMVPSLENDVCHSKVWLTKRNYHKAKKLLLQDALEETKRSIKISTNIITLLEKRQLLLERELS